MFKHLEPIPTGRCRARHRLERQRADARLRPSLPAEPAQLMLESAVSAWGSCVIIRAIRRPGRRHGVCMSSRERTLVTGVNGAASRGPACADLCTLLLPVLLGRRRPRAGAVSRLGNDRMRPGLDAGGSAEAIERWGGPGSPAWGIGAAASPVSWESVCPGYGVASVRASP